MYKSNQQIVLDNLIREHFSDVCIDKALVKKVGVLGRSLPAFVSDWLISRYSRGGDVDTKRIQEFLKKHLPDKQQKNVILNALLNGERVKILDSYSVRIDIKSGSRVLSIPCLDQSNAHIYEDIVETHPLLLLGNVWGSGSLVRVSDGEKGSGYILMDKFVPMQTSQIDLDYFIEKRRYFTLEQWINLLIRAMGYNPEAYEERQKMWLLTRLCPMVQPRVNLIEFAPKGTGKSYIYSQLSRQSWLIGGGTVTRAQLFYNMTSKCAGVITKYDVIVFDEVQSIRLTEPGEIVSALKGYLEYGKTNVMKSEVNGDAGFVLLANIPIRADGKPRDSNYFIYMPKWLQGQQATALIDRFHGLIPGWELPRITEEIIGTDISLKADYFGEILHSLRNRDEFDFYVNQHTECDGDIRDYNAVKRLSAGYMKLLFPDISQINHNSFYNYCLSYAKELRSSIRKQLSVLDPEFSPQIAKINMV